MCKPWKPGESTPAVTVSTVTVAYPLVKSMVASATCLPSAVFSCVVSFPALDPGEVVDVDELLKRGWTAAHCGDKHHEQAAAAARASS